MDNIVNIMTSFKIQSLSDIITNSSSEVFPVVAAYDAAERLEEIIDKLLIAADSPYCCGDLFDINSEWGNIRVTPRNDNPDIKSAAAYLEFIQDLFKSEE